MQQEANVLILASLTPAELAHAEGVLLTLRSMRAVPKNWTAEHVALTIRLGHAVDGGAA